MDLLYLPKQFRFLKHHFARSRKVLPFNARKIIEERIHSIRDKHLVWRITCLGKISPLPVFMVTFLCFLALMKERSFVSAVYKVLSFLRECFQTFWVFMNILTVLIWSEVGI